MPNEISLRHFKACMELVNESIRNNVYGINSGGCAFFASELAKRMRAAGIEDFSIAVFGDIDEDETELVSIEEAINDMRSWDDDLNCIYSWNDNGVRFSHVVVEWRGVKWDAVKPFTGKKWRGSFQYGRGSFQYEGSFPEDSLHAIAQCSDGWNSTYDREQNDTVREILDCAFDLLH